MVGGLISSKSTGPVVPFTNLTGRAFT
jgi:hypothetical protein